LARKAIRAIKAVAVCRVLKAIVLLAPRANPALAVWLEPLALLAPKGQKAIAEGTAQSAQRDKWDLVDFKDCVAIQGHKELKALAACKALRENAVWKDLKELWAYAVIPAHKGRRAKFPKARLWRFLSP
jgi:hypothetical protein